MPNKISKIERRNYIMANKEVMNEEVKMNEEATVVEIKKESKVKVIWNKIKKPVSYVAVLALGIGVGFTTAKGLGSDDGEVEETATEE